MTEQDIIKGCKRQDRKAYKAFVDSYSPYIYSICYRYMGNAEVAKDSLQETLIQVITNIDKYSEQGRFKSWLSSVTVKKCLDQLRKEKRHLYNDLENMVEPSNDEVSSLKLEKADVMQFIETIPERYRLVINMFLVEGYSHKEVAEELGITESSSRSLVARGRKMIAKAFDKESMRVSNRINNSSSVSGSTIKLKVI